MSAASLEFGDRVRVRATPETTGINLAGRVGQVYGFTTPSVTRVTVVGELKADYALNVHFEDPDQEIWLAPQLLELVDHAPGTEITLDGVPKRWVREADGSWREEATDGATSKHRPWWKLW